LAASIPVKRGNCQDGRRAFIGKEKMKIGKMEPLKEKTIKRQQGNSRPVFDY